MSEPASSPGLLNRASVTGLAGGFLLGVIDYVLLESLGIEMRFGTADVTLLVGGFFALSMGALGFVIGHLVVARRRVRASADTIQSQLHALEAAQARLIDTEKLAAIGRLAAGVAHEVRNPLGVIRTSASMLLAGLDPDDAAQADRYRACEFIVLEVDRLNRFVTALLDFSRPLTPERKSISLREVVDSATRLSADELSTRAVALEVQAADGAPVAQLDGDLLSRAVYGLITNAGQAIGRDGRVVIRVNGTPDEVSLEVADSGPGVTDDEVRAQLFEPFFTTKPDGTGLGLAMAARVVEAHGGSIELLDRHGAGPEGAGACFRIRLPTNSPGVAAMSEAPP